MKIIPLLMLGSAVLLGGCASTGTQSAAATDGGSSYVALGSNIPKKNGAPPASQTADLQQLENARTMGNATINSR
jgi:hypothetical protein